MDTTWVSGTRDTGSIPVETTHIIGKVAFRRLTLCNYMVIKY